MPEVVRLVVWDLDETFWKGTVSEGGIQYIDAHHDIVIELARRGILSSICSRNDLEPVKELLIDRGLWDYFVFPSINWESKGPRLAALVEAVQLRAPSILFLDDNPMNRNEALHFVPGIQVADETAIAKILDDPLCKGKKDDSLTRLKQYKLLETKNKDLQTSGDNTDFLLASNIRVTIDHNIETHLDRAIELINRTNQLNFTKIRVSEQLETARSEIRALLAQYDVQAGMVQVKDKYGDYGFVGVYVTRTSGSKKKLIHYCFSCRTLGMGVETWVYERLGRPDIKVVGEVLTEISSAEVPTWIRTGQEHDGGAEARVASRIFVRGGCDLTPVAHYLGLSATEVLGEFNIVRAGFPIRVDHTCFLRNAIEGFSQSAPKVDAIRAIGYEAEDMQSALTEGPHTFDVCLFSFWQDVLMAAYEHRELGFRVPFSIPPGDKAALDATAWQEADMRRYMPDERVLNVGSKFIAELKASYRFHKTSAAVTTENLQRILEFIPEHVTIIILLAAEYVPHSTDQPFYLGHLADHNKTIVKATAGRKNLHLLRITDFVKEAGEMINSVHFSRKVYFRLYEAVNALLEKPVGEAPVPAELEA